jgi:4-amino-4-deoxy-L-arabinose transferase-like glycosyltransferase
MMRLMTRPRGRVLFWSTVALFAGALLRAYCIRHYPQLQGDPQLYAEVIRNWMTRGVYGFTQDAGVRPTLIRLPGYPIFLGGCFRLFGMDNLHAALWVQVAVDLLTCGVLALLARRFAGERAAITALGLAVLCPFLAEFTAAGLTETLTLFCTVLAFWALQRWLDTPQWRWVVVLGSALAYAILLRPDQGLLAAAVLPAMLLGRGFRLPQVKETIVPTVACALLAVLPLVPWTVRNYRVFHVLQPLAPRYANDPGEPNPYGFQRWYRTWAIDYASTEDIYWDYDGDAMDFATLPARAFDSPEQYRETAAVFALYDETKRNSPEVDARFAALAEERVRKHPVRYYVLLPVARLGNMLLRPRVDWLPGPLQWWRWSESSPLQFGRALFLGALNLALIAFAAMGARRLRARPELRPILLAMATYGVLRCALLLTVDNSEPRYTVEFIPLWIVLTAVALTKPQPAALRES